MKFSEATRGRVFIIRLEQGEVVHEILEKFASEHGVQRAALLMVGAADRGSVIVCGPRDADARPVEPMKHTLPDVHELTGVGTLFPDEDGRPMLHVHAAFGREGKRQRMRPQRSGSMAGARSDHVRAYRLERPQGP